MSRYPGLGTYNPVDRTITWPVGEVGPSQGGYAEISVKVRDDAPSGTGDHQFRHGLFSERARRYPD